MEEYEAKMRDLANALDAAVVAANRAWLLARNTEGAPPEASLRRIKERLHRVECDVESLIGSRVTDVEIENARGFYIGAEKSGVDGMSDILIGVVGCFFDGKWEECDPAWVDSLPYRARPEPKRETREVYWGKVGEFTYGGPSPLNTHRITFDLIDREPDCDSVKMERL
jgi:hypothetical protein